MQRFASGTAAVLRVRGLQPLRMCALGAPRPIITSSRGGWLLSSGARGRRTFRRIGPAYSRGKNQSYKLMRLTLVPSPQNVGEVSTLPSDHENSEGGTGLQLAASNQFCWLLDEARSHLKTGRGTACGAVSTPALLAGKNHRE